MKKGFLNKQKRYEINRIDENISAYNDLEEEADDTFGYNLLDFNDPKTLSKQDTQRMIMKKGFLNKREHYMYNHTDTNIFAFNNDEEELADDTFGFDFNDPKMPSRYTDLADFNFFNRFHDDFDDQDFL